MEDKDRTIKSKQKEIEKLTEDNKKLQDHIIELEIEETGRTSLFAEIAQYKQNYD